MNNNPLISIVIPSFNGSNFLAKAIDSVLRQDYKNIELILINDCSTDNSLKIMREYQEKNTSKIKLINNQKNLGLSATLNKAFSFANGEVFGWISDDNIFDDRAISKMLSKMFANYPDSYDVIYGNYQLIDNLGKVTMNVKVGKIDKIIFKYAIGPCFIFKKECFDITGGFNEDYKMCEDYYFILQLYNMNFKFAKIDDFLFKFRIHNGQMSSNSKALIDNTEKIILDNAKNNKHKIGKKNLAKIYLTCFIKNNNKINFNLLVMAFFSHPLYFIMQIHKIIARILD
jgi:glycosyltransferase involved in cell wall biosynthesis